MKLACKIIVIMFVSITLSGLIVRSWSGGAEGRADFARNMSAPAKGLTASTSGTSNEVLVIHILGPILSPSEDVIQDKGLTHLRNKGFKRVEVRGRNDGEMMWEKSLD